jgi:hypothetical protein
MRLRSIASIAGFGLLGAVATAAPAAAMSVDGSMSDWGVNVVDTPATGGCSNTNSTNASICHITDFSAVPGTGVGNFLSGGGRLLGFSVQDANDTSNAYGNAAGLLSPYFGGQNFDAEFIGAAQQNGKLYVAIVTGQRPDNGTADWQPGDLRMQINSLGGPHPATGTYGIELGGGAATGSSSAKITAPGGAGSTYTDDANGFSSGRVATAWNTGDILKNATFVTHPSNLPLSADTQLSGGDAPTLAVTALYETLNSYQLQHNIIEMEIDLSTLLSNNPNDWPNFTLDLQWGPGCGNDLILTNLQLAANDIPAPASLALFGLGILGLGILRRRRAA